MMPFSLSRPPGNPQVSRAVARQDDGHTSYWVRRDYLGKIAMEMRPVPPRR